jgi:predicted O-methyltransferase YrrM
MTFEYSQLDDLAQKYGTDKQSSQHDYCRQYERILHPIRLSARNILEIGVLNGASLKMWRDYFHSAQIYGIDINPECAQYNAERIQIIIDDQDSWTLLDKLQNIPFDFIIDDASHKSTDQIASFYNLFPLLKPGGIYIIEDTCCSYWSSHNDDSQTTMEHFKTIVDDLNFGGLKLPHAYNRNSKDLAKYAQSLGKSCRHYDLGIESVHFGNSFIAIQKSDIIP